MKGQRGRGGQRKGKKVSCSRRERLAFFARPRSLCSLYPSASARPVAVGRGREGGRGDAVAWRASRSLTSVQSERLDHCQCRHVCRGSRSDARLQHQQPLVVRKRGGDWGRGWRGKTERRGREGRREGGGGGGGEERLGGLAARWRRNCSWRADLHMRREAEQVSESDCIASSGKEGSALELCYPPSPTECWMGVASVFYFNFPLK